jgi:hypothetical protein
MLNILSQTLNVHKVARLTIEAMPTSPEMSAEKRSNIAALIFPNCWRCLLLRHFQYTPSAEISQAPEVQKKRVTFYCNSFIFSLSG